MGAIRFPNLGFEIDLPQSFHIGKLEIYFYGIIIAIGLISGALLCYHEAKRTGQKADDYIDFTFFAVIGALICARIYYVAFEWDYYSKNLKEVFDIRGGGIAIYGAIIGGVIVLTIFTKVKKLKFFKMADTIIPGLLLGQIIGRWGNFVNREAFGGYTNNLLAMQIPVSDVRVGKITEAMKVDVFGTTYVQVHPTFFYESVLNLVLLTLILVFRDKKKFYGETLCRYGVGYGIIRFFVEGLRTDQLQFSNGIAVSQIVSILIAAVGLFFIIFMRVRLRGKESVLDPIPVKAKKGAKATEEEIKEETEEYEEEESEDETENENEPDSVLEDIDTEEDRVEEDSLETETDEEAKNEE